MKSAKNLAILNSSPRKAEINRALKAFKTSVTQCYRLGNPAHIDNDGEIIIFAEFVIAYYLVAFAAGPSSPARDRQSAPLQDASSAAAVPRATPLLLSTINATALLYSRLLLFSRRQC